MTGTRELKSVVLTPEVVDPDDIEMLQDLIVAAINEVTKKIDEESQAELSRLTGGFGGLF